MNVRVTIALVVAAIAVGVVVYINPFQSEPEPVDDSPWFFQLAEEDIQSIEVIHRVPDGQTVETVSFVKTSPEHYLWEFVEPEGVPPDRNRWGGITLLLSGPKTRRDLTPQNVIIEDPAEYGLDDPATVVKVGLTLDRDLEFRLGHETTDGFHHYGQVIGFPQLFIIADSWGDVIARLAVEPPIPRWYVEHTSEDIVEVNVHDGPRFDDETQTLTFDYDDEDGWTVQLRNVDEDKRPIDTERWAEVQKLLGRPLGVAVAVPFVDDRDTTPWGVGDDSRVIEIRFPGTSQGDVNFTDGDTYMIGNRVECEDDANVPVPCENGVVVAGQDRYYVQRISDHLINPILYVDAIWVDTLFALFDDIPYGEEPASEG